MLAYDDVVSRQGKRKKVKARRSRAWWTKDEIWMLTVWTLGGGRSLWILPISIFSKTWEIFPSVTRVLSIFLTTAGTTASVERVNSKVPV